MGEYKFWYIKIVIYNYLKECIMANISDRYTRKNFLYNINSLNNLKSILEHGILSKNELIRRNISYQDLSNHSVQDKRDCKYVLNRRTLHDYANLYFDARNPMLFNLVSNKNINELCVLCVDKRVLDIPGTVVTDMNAAALLAVFENPEKALERLDFDRIFARSWYDEDRLEMESKKKIKCAEVLVYNHIEPQYIKGILVPNDNAKQLALSLGLNLRINIDNDLFFGR